MDVFRQRLEDEYDANIIITAPTVPYKVIYKDKTVMISNPTEFPDTSDTSSKVKQVQEPVVNASIIVPEEYMGEMMNLCFAHRAENLDHRYLDSGSTPEASARAILTCTLPLSEIVTDFFDQLKSRSSGYASFDYEDGGYKASDLTKMVFLLNGKPVDALALVVHRSAQHEVGKKWVKKLHKVIPRQLFEVPIQAAIGKKIIARETLSAMRADVTAGLYGGHYERKMKHLENQKESKRKMKRIGSVDLPQDAFFDILSTKNK
jgi:elongation factor 4